MLLIVCYFPPNFDQLPSRGTRLRELKQLDYGGFVRHAAGLVLVLLAFGMPFQLSDAHGSQLKSTSMG